MRNVLEIVRNDFRVIRQNTMTGIMVFGLVLIPLLFTCFNVLASWEPFENTEKLKIAVASNDRGHRTDIGAIDVNLGNEVLSKLSRNHEIDWQITDSEDAIDGTKSGDYYAAIVLPENFSTELMTFYVRGTKAPKLTLYTNEKKNALSSIITSKGASGVIQEIDKNFTQVVASVGLGVITSLDEYLNTSDSKQALTRVQNRVDDTAARLRSGAQTARSLSTLVETTVPLVETADSILENAGARMDILRNGSGDGNVAGDLEAAVGNVRDSVSTALDATQSSYEGVRDRVNELVDGTQATSGATADTFDAMAAKFGQQADGLTAMRDRLEDTVGAVVPGVAKPGYDRAISDLNTSIARTRGLQESFSAVAADLRGGRDTGSSISQAKDAFTAAIAAVENAKNSYEQNLRPQIDALSEPVSRLSNDIEVIGEDIRGIRGTISGSPVDTLRKTSAATMGLSNRFDDLAARFDEIHNALEEAKDTGDLSRIAEAVGDDPSALAAQLAAPVQVEEDPVFPVQSFGAGMAPFYATLALWIGALLSSVLIRTTVRSRGGQKVGDDEAENVVSDAVDDAQGDAASDEIDEPTSDAQINAAQADDYTRVEKYFGRFATFASVGLVQSTLMVLGLQVYVGIEPAHRFLMLLAGWVISLVFMMIVFSFVFTFDNAGKAICVLLLVMQVSAAGGAYPLPLVPQWVQNISPWLPGTYAIDMFRSSIAGIYEADYWKLMFMLALFIIPSLILALGLQRIFEKGINEIKNAIEETKVMATS
ncbi:MULTISPECIES: YhgE/Pip domain-containing protein [Corynebacterium]|uniref:YhgE/Pip domain-containing protein n=1 Tax=Corynebacterium TaxID=1716 RepID=UPI00034E72D5|nr:MULTISPECIES: YhgE/Pip domain-containing protein [Corynebacterium]ASE57147.1 YhgE/Pip domain-containing protein [Corynebacterium jeikeium]EPD48622.1 YhgE/Pip domain-containing protein [Corynebacterium sp. HFH0082]MCT1548090.1 YhgE/Pip domain-containing protein [Corynebacterium amycolatum]OFR61956.1 YhgE/Pip domain-containing protein [Corynebacterium sp. HMSC065H09]OHR25813.1 YhgE/Pip domain-containing protein [Corynebacterium sp. HMSC072D01]